MRILFRNLIDDYDPLDFSSERANLWATNVKIHHLIVPWRTLTPDAQYYTLDAGVGETITADCAAIAGHNLSGLNQSFCDRGDCESATPPMVKGETVPLVVGATWGPDATEHYEGIQSYRFTKTVAAGDTAWVFLTDNQSATDMHGFLPGQTVTKKFRLKIPSGAILGSEISVILSDYASGAWQTTNVVAQNIYDAWQEITVIRTLRSTCTGLTIYLRADGAAALNEYFNVDDIEIDKVPVARIMANDTNNWTAPALSETFDWGAGPMMAFFASTSKRFWRFEIDDPANPDGYLQIGRLGLGEYLQMPPIEPGAELPEVTTSQPSTSISGQVFGNDGQILLAPAFSLPIISQSERLQIREMFAEVKNIRPVFLAVWEESLDVQDAIYCRIDQDRLEFKKAKEAGVLWMLDLSFMEVK